MNLLEEALIAVERNNVQRLQAALRRQPSLASDGYGNGGGTLLHVAAITGSTDCLKHLLTGGACVEEVTAKENVTALFWAAQEGHEACVRELLAAGATVEAAAKNSQEPLHVAAQQGHLGCLQQLLDAGASVAATDEDGQVPLHFAAGKGHLPAIRCLVAAGASMAVQDGEGLTPRMRATNQGKLEAAQLLLELERQQAGRRQADVPSSSRTPQQAEAAGTATASTAAALASTAETSATAVAGARMCAAEACSKTSGLLLCGSCKTVRYCSEACSHAHWKAHKPECRRLRTAAAAAQP